MTKSKRRLIPIVDRRFQFKYTAIIVAMAVLVAVPLGYFLLQAYAEMNAMLEISAAVNDQMNQDDATRVFRLVVGFLLILVVALGMLGLLITHRVCGPIAVLHGYFNTIGEGRWPEARTLRKGDEFGAAFVSFSNMLDALRQRERREVAALEAAKESGDAAAMSAALAALIDEKNERLNAPATGA